MLLSPLRSALASAVRSPLEAGRRVAVSRVTVFDFLAAVPAGVTFVRGAGDDRLHRDGTGQWVRVSGSTPRLHHTTEGAPLGLVLERSFVDKTRLGFNFATAPTDTTGGFLTAPAEVSITPDPASLDAEGFAAFTSALRFAPAADKNWQLRHTVGNLNKHTIMGVIRDNRGTGTATFSRILMTGAANVSPPVYDEWAMVLREDMTPSTTSRIGQVTAVAGHNFDVAGVWLCETPYAPLPYWRATDNVAAVVADEYATADLGAVPGWSAAGCTLFYEWFHDRPFSVDGEPLVTLVDSGSSGDFVKIGGRADGGLRVEVFVGGASVYSADFVAPTRYEAHVAAIRLQPGQIMAAVDGVAGAGVVASPSLAALDAIHINRHGSQYGNQFARSLAITQEPLTDAALLAAATVSGGYI